MIALIMLSSTTPTPKLFLHLLGNNLIAGVTNNFVWFALTFWAILETNSVLVASYIAGIFAVVNMIGAIFFGGFVDHQRKQVAMMVSSIVSLIMFGIGTAGYFFFGFAENIAASSLGFWTLVFILMIGTVFGNMRNIALATSVTILFSKDRDKANGLVGTMQGISFAVTSVFSGLVIGFFGMGAALVIALITTTIALLHIILISFPETIPSLEDGQTKRLDLRGTFAIIFAIPGLLALIFFNTINNLLGGVFMALMDIYGLSLVSVEAWGILWGVASLFMIGGGIIVSKYGVGKNPVRTIMLVNLITWLMCMIFPLQASIILLVLGMFTWMFFFPIIEAAEQTVIQNIVPPKRQGRVFGFASSIESIASPVTAFAIGPIAQVFFIPFMTTGLGVSLIGNWFGVGDSRGIALVFIAAGFFGFLLTLFAILSRPYRQLSNHYQSTQEKL